MKIHGVKRMKSSPFFLYFKKHYCPVCNELLKSNKVSKVVNSSSQEAKGFDFSTGDGYAVGNIKFIWTELRCNACDRSYSIEEIKATEKKN